MHEIEHTKEEEPTANTLIWMLWAVIAVLIFCGYGLKKHYEPQPEPKAIHLYYVVPVGMDYYFNCHEIDKRKWKNGVKIR